MGERVEQSATVDLRGALRVVHKAGNKLAPVFEAFTNAWEAIEEKYQQNLESGQINISLFFTYVDSQKLKYFESIEITDNGIGFTESNYARFNDLFNGTKGKGNRGSGRLQYVHSFEDVRFESIYLENKSVFSRMFHYNKQNGKNFIGDTLFAEAPNEEQTGTSVTMSQLKNQSDQMYYNSLSIGQLKISLIIQYLFKFSGHSFPKITINFFYNNELKETQNIDLKDIPTPTNTVELEVAYKKPVLQELKNKDNGTSNTPKVIWEPTTETTQLQATNFVLPSSVASGNKITLYSQNTAIQDLSFPDIFKSKEIIGNSHFLTAIQGKYLDSLPVADEGRSKLQFPDKHTIEQDTLQGSLFPSGNKYIFLEDVKDSVRKSLPAFYPSLKIVLEERKTNVNAIVKTFNISDDTVRKTDLELGDISTQKILEKFYITEAQKKSKKDAEIKQIYDSVCELNPSDEQYFEKLKGKSKELLNLIPQQNSEDLSLYIARREMVIALLDKILSKETTIQKQWNKNEIRKQTEELLHNLLFRKYQSTVPTNSDLWILNEDFIYFSGHSEIALKDIKVNNETLFRKNLEDEVQNYGIKIPDTRRPDICLFPEEGKCILIELKAPDADAKDFLLQIQRYARLIANCSKEKFQINQFYGYLIIENINEYDTGGFQPGIQEGTWFHPSETLYGIKDESKIVKGVLYQEIIKWSALRERASKRNRKFAELLNIRYNYKKPAHY